MRLFVAVTLPDDIKRKVEQILQDLTEGVRQEEAEIKWVKREQLHFTLKFLGDCPEEQLLKITHALEKAVQDVPAFSVTVGGLGTFPEKGLPRVIWVGLLEGANAMVDLATRLEGALEPLGFARDDRPYSPHLTLGRVKSVKNQNKVRSVVEMNKPEPLGTYTVHSVNLDRSNISSKGPTYNVLFTAALT